MNALNLYHKQPQTDGGVYDNDGWVLYYLTIKNRSINRKLQTDMPAKLCVIVGAGPGIALAVANRFGREGYSFALIARRQEALNSYVAGLAAAGISAQGYTADIADFDALAATLTRIQQTQGDADLLLYNASEFLSGTPTTYEPESFMHSQRICFGGLVVAVQALVPQMERRGGGTILTTGGGSAFNPTAASTALSVGKAGLRNLTLGLADELAQRPIRVATLTVNGAVQPGTHFDPVRIAEVFWELAQQPVATGERERIYQ